MSEHIYTHGGIDSTLLFDKFKSDFLDRETMIAFFAFYAKDEDHRKKVLKWVLSDADVEYLFNTWVGTKFDQWVSDSDPHGFWIKKFINSVPHDDHARFLADWLINVLVPNLGLTE